MDRINTQKRFDAILQEKKKRLDNLLWNVRYEDFVSADTANKLNNYFQALWKDISFYVKECQIIDDEKDIWTYDALICLDKWREFQISRKDYLQIYF